MIKSALAAVVAVPFLTTAALAGPYVEIENNAGYTGSDYEASVTDFHVGYEGDLAENVTYYIQGGPALVNVEGEGVENEYSGKAGLGLDVTERLNVYGEVSFLTDSQEFSDDLGWGTKLGAKFTF